MKQRAKILFVLYVIFGATLLLYIIKPPFSGALESPNYKFVETSLGGAGLIDTESANFQASTSAGVLGGVNQIGTASQFNSGNLTTNDPTLTFAITDSTADFNLFSAAAASTATSTFEVINYTSYGYVVQIDGSTLANGSNTIESMASTGPSQVGTEQFGINLVANTSPISLGANPNNGQFGFGQAASNYNVANNYRFVSGETIATAPKSSGKTIYTISYIVNVAALTQGGRYTSNQTIIVTGTY